MSGCVHMRVVAGRQGWSKKSNRVAFGLHVFKVVVVVMSVSV